jgi:hypothetical protein
MAGTLGYLYYEEALRRLSSRPLTVDCSVIMSKTREELICPGIWPTLEPSLVETSFPMLRARDRCRMPLTPPVWTSATLGRPMAQETPAASTSLAPARHICSGPGHAMKEQFDQVCVRRRPQKKLGLEVSYIKLTASSMLSTRQTPFLSPCCLNCSLAPAPGHHDCLPSHADLPSSPRNTGQMARPGPRVPKRPSSTGELESGEEEDVPRPKRAPAEPDFSGIVRNKLHQYTRTGQACDRCKVRPMTALQSTVIGPPAIADSRTR